MSKAESKNALNFRLSRQAQQESATNRLATEVAQAPSRHKVAYAQVFNAYVTPDALRSIRRRGAPKPSLAALYRHDGRRHFSTLRGAKQGVPQTSPRLSPNARSKAVAPQQPDEGSTQQQLQTSPRDPDDLGVPPEDQHRRLRKKKKSPRGSKAPALSATKRNASNLNEADLEVLRNANPDITGVKEGAKLEESADDASKE